jgi:hypothetical protein
MVGKKDQGIPFFIPSLFCYTPNEILSCVFSVGVNGFLDRQMILPALIILFTSFLEDGVKGCATAFIINLMVVISENLCSAGVKPEKKSMTALGVVRKALA